MCKTRIYLSKIDMALSQETYDGLLQIISKENRERCLRFRRREDALRTLYGELIVRHVLCQQFSLKNEAIAFSKSNKGKPYVKDSPVHFNISHAGDFVVCAFSEQEVGIDIEQIRAIDDLDLTKRYFHKCEYEDLLVLNASRRLDYFFSLWTLKESYMKWLGDGMSIPLNSFFFKITADDISMVDTNRDFSPFFKQYSVDGYSLSLCSAVSDFPDKMDNISVENLCFRGL